MSRRNNISCLLVLAAATFVGWATADAIPVILLASSTGRLCRVIESLDKFAQGVEGVHMIFELQNPCQGAPLAPISATKNRMDGIGYTWRRGFSAKKLLYDTLKIMAAVREKVVIISDAFALNVPVNLSETQKLLTIKGFRGKEEDGIFGVCLTREDMHKLLDWLDGNFDPSIGRCFTELVKKAFEQVWRDASMRLTVFGQDAVRLLDREPEVFDHNSDTAVLDIASHYLPKAPTILEAGAFCGDTTRMLSKMWPNGHVYAFEPMPEIFKPFCVFTRDLSNVSRYMMALTNREGIGLFHPRRGSDGLDLPTGSLLEFGPLHKQALAGDACEDAVSVKLETISSWADKNAVPGIDFMWLDMEGGELAAMKGAPDLLRKTAVVYSEVTLSAGIRKSQPLHAELADFMSKLGFVEVLRDFFAIRGRCRESRNGGNSLFVREDVWLRNSRPLMLGAPCDVPILKLA